VAERDDPGCGEAWVGEEAFEEDLSDLTRRAGHEKLHD
jgi:hypothetical protein